MISLRPIKCQMSAASWTFLNVYTPVVARIWGHSGDGLRMDWGWIVKKSHRTYGPQTGILGIRRRIPFVAVAQWLRLQTPIRKPRVRTPAATFFYLFGIQPGSNPGGDLFLFIQDPAPAPVVNGSDSHSQVPGSNLGSDLFFICK